MIRITIQKNSLVPQFTNTYQLDIWEKSIPWRNGNSRNMLASPSQDLFEHEARAQSTPKRTQKGLVI